MSNNLLTLLSILIVHFFFSFRSRKHS